MKNNWKEEFDNLMDNYLRHFADAVISKRVIESINKEQDNILYSFITSLLAQQKKELMESSLEEIGSWDYDMIANSTPYQLYEKYIESLKHHD